MNFVQLILSLTTHFGWKIQQMDVKSDFLHGNLSKYIYMEHPLCFRIDYNLFCQLQKSLYSLKQTRKASYEKIDQFFVNMGFKHCEYNHSIYLLHVKGDTLIVVVYVDDLFLTSNNIDIS